MDRSAILKHWDLNGFLADRIRLVLILLRREASLDHGGNNLARGEIQILERSSLGCHSRHLFAGFCLSGSNQRNDYGLRFPECLLGLCDDSGHLESADDLTKEALMIAPEFLQGIGSCPTAGIGDF